MKREWQPGDVATGTPHSIADQDDPWRVFFYRDHDDNIVKYMWDDGSGDEATNAPSDLRPLALIDPEAAISDEWVDAFVDAWDHSTVHDNVRAGLAALFAHIAAPSEPKPEEPTGDRATVLDRDGVLWTRDEEPVVEGYRWVDLSAGQRTGWSDLDVPADGVLWGGVE